MSVPFVTPEQFGARHDGVTDDYHALMATLYAGPPVHLLDDARGRPYLTSRPLELPKYTMLRGTRSSGCYIKAAPGFVGANLLQNWRAADGTDEHAPRVTSGLGFPCHILFLRDFGLDTGDQPVNLLSLVHLQEGTSIRDLVLQGHRAPVRGNPAIADGIRLLTNEGDGGSNQSWTLRDIVAYGQFRRVVDAYAVTSWGIERLTTGGATLDDVRVTSGENLSFRDLQIMVPQSQADDAPDTAALHLRGCQHVSADNVLLGLGGEEPYIWREGVRIEAYGGPMRARYHLTNLRTTYNGAGAARFACDVRDTTQTPERELRGQSFAVITPETVEPMVGVRDGEWQAMPATFAGNGSLVWTVSAAPTLRYMRVGRTVTVQWCVTASRVEGVGSALLIRLPTGVVAAARMNGDHSYSMQGGDAGSFWTGYARVDAGGTAIELYTGPIDPWPTMASFQTNGCITFEAL